MTFLFARGGHSRRSEKPVPKLKVFGQLDEANALARVVYAFLIGGHVAILLAVDHRSATSLSATGAELGSLHQTRTLWISNYAARN